MSPILRSVRPLFMLHEEPPATLKPGNGRDLSKSGLDKHFKCYPNRRTSEWPPRAQAG